MWEKKRWDIPPSLHQLGLGESCTTPLFTLHMCLNRMCNIAPFSSLGRQRRGHSSLFMGRQVGDSRHCSANLYVVPHTWTVEALLPHYFFPRFDKTRGDLKDDRRTLECGRKNMQENRKFSLGPESTNQIVVSVEFHGAQAELS